MAEKTELLEEDEKVVEIELERLRGFENHPFKVRAMQLRWIYSSELHGSE